MKTKTLQILAFALFLAVPPILAKLFPRIRIIFYIIVAIIIYAAISRRIRNTPLRVVFFGICMYIFHQLFLILGPGFMFYWVAGSLGFGFISSIIIFGIGGP